MYLRTTTSRGRTYLQIAESTWDPKRQRSVTKVHHSVGRVDDPEVVEGLRGLAQSILKRLSPEEVLAEQPDWRAVDAWPHGDVHVLEALWKRLEIDQALREVLKGRRHRFDVERALFAMVANRALAPASKLYCFEQWLREDVRIEGSDALELHHLYRSMDLLAEHQEALEERIFFRVANLLNLDVELIFYDTTSLHFETPDPDEGDDALRLRGFSKNGRGDAAQVVVGLAVTRDGFPVKHWVFPGNTVDVTTVKQVREDLRGWRLSRCVFVGDAGMVSQENLRALARAGGRYIVSVPVHRGGEVATEVLSRAGRYKAVAGNLRVKEVTVGEGERRRRYVVCHNPQQEERQRRHREALIRDLEAELASMSQDDRDEHSRRACALRSSRRYGRYLRTTRGGKLAIDRAKVREKARLDGKFIVTTNDDSLLPEDLALGYKQLLRVEAAWRRMKSGLRMRPVHHWTESRIRAHIYINVLALLLERSAEVPCGDTWRNIRDDLKAIKLVELKGPGGTVRQTTPPPQAAIERLAKLNIEAPSPIVDVR